MASEGQVASRPIHRRSVPSPAFAVKEWRQANGKRRRNSRLTVQQPELLTAFPGRAIDWDFARQRVSFRSPPENWIRPATTPMCATEPLPARMEFQVAGLWQLQHERRQS